MRTAVSAQRRTARERPPTAKGLTHTVASAEARDTYHPPPVAARSTGGYASTWLSGLAALVALPHGAQGAITQFFVSEATPAAPSVGIRISSTGIGSLQYCLNYLQPCASYVVERGNFSNYAAIPVVDSLCDVALAGPNSSATECMRLQLGNLESTDGREWQYLTLGVLACSAIGLALYSAYRDCGTPPLPSLGCRHAKASRRRRQRLAERESTMIDAAHGSSHASYDLIPPPIWRRALDRVRVAVWPSHGLNRTLDAPCQTASGFQAFRRTDDPFSAAKSGTLPPRKGLETLRASGSSQFTCKALSQIRSALPPDAKLYDVDIRQESHGFDGDVALGWWRRNNTGNLHKSVDEVRLAEVRSLAKLNALPRGSEFIAYVFGKSENKAKALTLRAHKACDEAAVARQTGVRYDRIPMTDRSAEPPDVSVNLFVDRLLDLDHQTWVHFHCLHGHGRTTLYMAMYDMLRNALSVSVDEVVQRQHLLGGVDLSAKTAATQTFLRCFHAYSAACIEAKDRGDLVPIWSQWKQTYVDPALVGRFCNSPSALHLNRLDPA